MAIRIGTNPIAWSNDDLPELGGATPLETCLSEARSAGYVGIELGNKFPRNASQLQPICRFFRHHSAYDVFQASPCVQKLAAVSR